MNATTCAGRPLGRLLELPNIRPCDRGKAWARSLRTENLEERLDIHNALRFVTKISILHENEDH